MKFCKKLIIMLLVISVIASAFMIPASSAGNIAYGACTIDASLLNVRSGPGQNYSVVTTVARNSRVVILEKTNSDWYHINHQGAVGYISTDYIKEVLTAENFKATGTVDGSGVRMREKPNTTSANLGTYNNGTKMAVIGINNGWYKVQYSGKTGYIRSDLMKITGAPASSSSSSSSSSGNSGSTNNKAPAYTPSGNVSLGQQIADFASQYIGYPYVYGAESPAYGFDCSGLVYYTCKQLGISISRTARQQYKNHGVQVSKANLQPGDLVFFSSNGGYSITHVGIYTGDSKFVHASTSKVGVITSDLDSAYYTKVWYGAKRIV